MSKEKQCKCCKEYWWEMNIHSTSGLCPNCYDYVADLEAKLAESEEFTQVYRKECAKIQSENVKLKQQLAEKEQIIEANKVKIKSLNEINLLLKSDVQMAVKIQNKHNQDKILFAVDILEELADCSNYINSKLDFECGSYVSEKTIRDKIKYLKGKKDE